jgi:hypothetical protein
MGDEAMDRFPDDGGVEILEALRYLLVQDPSCAIHRVRLDSDDESESVQQAVQVRDSQQSEGVLQCPAWPHPNEQLSQLCVRVERLIHLESVAVEKFNRARAGIRRWVMASAPCRWLCQLAQDGSRCQRTPLHYVRAAEESEAVSPNDPFQRFDEAAQFLRLVALRAVREVVPDDP